MKRTQSAYAKAGVDIDEKMAALDAIKKMVRKTRTPGVLSDIGLFGGLFASPGAGRILAATTDGVGTKLKVAVMAGRHDTVGQDIVNHCVNDLLVQGAKPLFFLDYLATSRFDANVFRQIVSGLCKACRENDCALLGGETAEMPGLYPPGEYDLVGTMVGVVDRNRLVVGKDIKPGDMIIGLASTGLHTNGYSLARKVFFEQAKLTVDDPLPGTRQTVGEALLAVHKSYLRPVQELMKRVRIRGMAHITGGGFTDNVPRILPADACAVFDRKSWNVPAIFRFIRERGRVDREEMYRVFNMGIGFVVIVRRKDAGRALDILREAEAKPATIGWIERGERRVRFVN